MNKGGDRKRAKATRRVCQRIPLSLSLSLLLVPSLCPPPSPPINASQCRWWCTTPNKNGQHPSSAYANIVALPPSSRARQSCQPRRIRLPSQPQQAVPSSIDWRVTEILPLGLLAGCFFAPLLRFCLYLPPPSIFQSAHAATPQYGRPRYCQRVHGEVGRSIGPHANMDGENGRGILHLSRDVLAPRTLEWGT